MVVMIVDDNTRIRAMIRELLADTGSTFYECCDGREAVAAYDVCKPDWVLMDIVMKEMDGITATEAICREHPTAKVTLVTNYDDPALKQKAADIGAKGFVLKENLSELKTIVRKLFPDADDK